MTKKTTDRTANRLISAYRARQDVEMITKQLDAAKRRLTAAEKRLDAIAQREIDRRLGRD